LQSTFQLLNYLLYSQVKSFLLTTGKHFSVAKLSELPNFWTYCQAIFLLIGNLQPTFDWPNYWKYGQATFPLPATCNLLLSCQSFGHMDRQYFLFWKLATSSRVAIL